MAQYLHKGSLVGVEGRIQTRSYDDQTGKRVYITEVVADSVQFLESKASSTNNAQAGYTPDYNANNQGYEPESQASYPDDNDTLKIAEEDLPF